MNTQKQRLNALVIHLRGHRIPQIRKIAELAESLQNEFEFDDTLTIASGVLGALIWSDEELEKRTALLAIALEAASAFAATADKEILAKFDSL